MNSCSCSQAPRRSPKSNLSNESVLMSHRLVTPSALVQRQIPDMGVMTAELE